MGRTRSLRRSGPAPFALLAFACFRNHWRPAFAEELFAARDHQTGEVWAPRMCEAERWTATSPNRGRLHGIPMYPDLSCTLASDSERERERALS